MKRSTSRVTIGGGQCRVTVKMESEQCEPESVEGRRRQIALIRGMTDNAELMNCGFKPFQKLTMKHTGEVWVIEMEAVQPE